MTGKLTILVRALLLVSLYGCAAPMPHSSTHTANGLAYEVVGRGPLVVLIHGSNLDRRMWDGEMAWLPAEARVLRYDLRGQGASASPTDAYADHTDLLALLDGLGAQEAVLVGLSAGAQVALHVALEAPERVHRLVLVSPSLTGYVPERVPAFFTPLREALRVGNIDQANNILLASPLMAVPAAYTDRVATMVADNRRLWTMSYALVVPVSPPALERLDEIDVPTLVLVGSEDIDAIRAQGVLLSEGLREGHLVDVPGGGHLLNMTSPEAFREAVRSFLGLSEE